MNMNGCMKQVLAVVLVAASGVGLADEWYVDPVNGLDGRDGSCSNVVSETVGPRKTLEKAMELVQAGDTLWLLPGEYKEGSMRDGRCRLWVKKPNVRIRSTAGADRTFIVGHGTAITDADAMNCVQVYEWASGVVLDGITLREAEFTP